MACHARDLHDSVTISSWTRDLHDSVTISSWTRDLNDSSTLPFSKPLWVAYFCSFTCWSEILPTLLAADSSITSEDICSLVDTI